MTDNPTFFHGTKAAMSPGDLILPGYLTNFGSGKAANHVYFTATMDAAIWGAELARGSGQGRIYRVAPLGPFEDDPNLTNKKFPGNPTRSYRSRSGLRVLDEVTDWIGHAPEALASMQSSIARLRQEGIFADDD